MIQELLNYKLVERLLQLCGDIVEQTLCVSGSIDEGV